MLLGLLAAGSAAILGGDPTAVGDYPSVVLVTVGQYLCTGTLITPRYVMTAGHCVDARLVGLASDEAVVTALRIRFDALDYKSGAAIGATNVIRAGFDASNVGTHDIAVIELDRDVFERSPSRVNFDAAAAPAAGTVVTMVGYGVADAKAPDTGGYERDLVGRVSAPCGEVAPGYPATDANMLCFAQTDAKGKCHGDSGGPSFAMIDGEAYVVGLTSFGDEDCALFSADTRIDAEAQFLRDNVPDVCGEATCHWPTDEGGCAAGQGAGSAVAGAFAIFLRNRRRVRR